MHQPINIYCYKPIPASMGQTELKPLIKQGWTQKFGRVEVLIPPQDLSLKEFRVSLDLQRTKINFSNWQTLIRQFQADVQIREYMVIPSHWEEANCTLCNNHTRTQPLKIFYPFFSCSLSQEIKSRREVSKHFTEQQLWYLFFVLLRVAAYFEGKGSYVGNVHPTNVLLHQSKICVFATISSPNQPLNLQRIRDSKYEDAFIAPEQTSLVGDHFSEREQHLDQNKIDSFNIGLVLLAAMTFKDWYEVYDRGEFAINSRTLNSHIELLNCQGKYSPSLCNWVTSLLIIDPAMRKTPHYYFITLQKYQKAILQLQSFAIDALVKFEPQPLSSREKSEPKGKFITLSKKKKSPSPQQNDKAQESIPTTLARKLFVEKEVSPWQD